MTRLADVILNARLNAKLSRDLMARMVGIEEPRVRQLEGGEVEPTPNDLDAYAQVFGNPPPRARKRREAADDPGCDHGASMSWRRRRAVR